MDENKGRYRCGYIYETKIRNNGNLELEYLIDSNHEIIKNGNKIEFVKKEGWDYKKWSFDCAILSIIGNGNYAGELHDYFNSIFRGQEKEWQAKEI